MRTTVTLDPDVEALLEAAMRERGLSFKQALNEAVRTALARGKRSGKPFRQRTFAMGIPKVDLTKALSIASEMEDQEILRKMRMGK
jgi:hypothetical protein